MWNLKNSTNEVIYKTNREKQKKKQKQTHGDRKQTYGYLRGSGGRINWEYGITQIHTTICKTDNKDLGCSTENYIQYLIINYNGKEPKKEYRCVCMYKCNLYCKYKYSQYFKSIIFQFKKEMLAKRRHSEYILNASTDRMLLNSLT